MSGSEFSYEHCPEDVKKAMLGKMASNDFAENSFAGVTAQIQCFGRIGMSAAAAVSDTARNGYLFRGEMPRRINRKRKRASATVPEKEKKHGLYHGLPKELQITLMLMCMEDAPETRARNNEDLERARAWRVLKEEKAKEEGLADLGDEFIESLIYHKMWDSDACWKTVGAVTEGLRKNTNKRR